MLKKINWVVPVFMTILVFLIVKKAWMSSDGLSVIYQTLNLFGGDGLTWNVGERTYVSTSPLLTIVTIVFSCILIPIFDTWGVSVVKYMGIANNLIVSSVFLFFLYKYLKRISSKITTQFRYFIFLFLLVVVLCSNYFIDFFTGGLENPLSYLFTFLFASVLLNNEERQIKSTLPIILSFLFLVRYDFTILFFPALLFLLIKYRWCISNIIMASIVLMWFAFALVYFGSIFPNSFYLKTNHYNFYQSFYYLWSNMIHSPAMFVLIFVGLYCSFFGNKLLFVGLLSYFIYVCVVKDYMLGRLFTVLIPACIVSIAWHIVNGTSYFGLNKYVVISIVILIFLNGSLKTSVYKYGKYNLSDERAYYTKYIPLLQMDLQYVKQKNAYVYINKDLTMLHSPFLPPHHSQTYYLDPVGLSNPLVTYYIKNFGSKGDRPGHYQADLKYLKNIGVDESILKNKNLIKTKNIRELYDDVNIVAKSDIFDYKRFKTILKLHSHNYNSQ